MHSGLGIDTAQTHGEPNTKYFNRKQNGGGGDVLAKGTPDVSGFNGGGGVGGGKWKSIPFTVQDTQS